MLYAKLFLAFSLSFGVFFGLAMFAITGSAFVLILFGVLGGLGFGILMSAVLGTLHVGSARTDAALSVKQSKFIGIQSPPYDVFDKALATLKTQFGKKCRIVEESRSTGEIRARTPMNWKSFGEDIFIKISQSSDRQQSLVTITSRPKIRTTLVDYGRDYENVNRISRALIQPI
jgi:hypothetical protein